MSQGGKKVTGEKSLGGRIREYKVQVEKDQGGKCPETTSRTLIKLKYTSFLQVRQIWEVGVGWGES